MLWFISRILRSYDINLPNINRCRAFRWVYQGSFFNKCDCNIWCKYPENNIKINRF